jgi:acetylornithine deacetylase/succinyl-diaminopimelate desuccinylase-like protein
MKGGVAAIIAAAEHLVANDAPVRPVLALVADEEDASLGSEAVIAALPRLGIRPDVCLIAEPTDLTLSRSLRGFVAVRVRFAGRAAHSSEAELGVKAVTHLGRLVRAVDQRAAAVRAAGGDVLVTMVGGGRSAFAVPDEAECLVELRTTPDQPSGEALALVEALLDPNWQAETELVAPGRLAPRRIRARCGPVQAAGHRARHQSDVRRALLDGGPLAARMSDAGLRPVGRWAARGRRVGRPRSSQILHHSAGARADGLDPRWPLTRAVCATTPHDDSIS